MELVRRDLMAAAHRLFYRPPARSSMSRTPETFEGSRSSTGANIYVSQALTLPPGTVTGTDGGSRLPWLCDGKDV